MDSVSTWTELMEDFFGVRLSDDKAARWVKLIRDPDAIGTSANEAELCEVLRFVRKQREGESERRAPTLETLIGWVKWYRKNTRARRGGYSDNDQSHEAKMSRCKASMLRSADHSARWEILCDGHGVGDVLGCQELMAWAATRWPDWNVAIVGLRQSHARDMRNALARIVRDGKVELKA